MQQFLSLFSRVILASYPRFLKSIRTFGMLDGAIFQSGCSASKVMHNCDNHKNLCVQQHKDSHSDLCIQQHKDLSYVILSVRKLQWACNSVMQT